MLSLFSTIIFAIFTAYFATQNTQGVSIHFFQYTFSEVPLYLLLLLALLLGFLFTYFFYIINNISVYSMLKSRKNSLDEVKSENVELAKKVHQLELENAKLATKDESLIEDNSL